MMNRHTIILLIVIGMGTSCVEKYWPTLEKYDNVFVIDGMLTNSTELIYVKLSYSDNLKEEVNIPVSNCNVYVLENQNTEIPFKEVDKGCYKPVDDSFTGTPGKQYQLVVNSPDGNSYLSENIKMLPSRNIDSIYSKREKHFVQDRGYPLYGLQFYIDTYGDNCDTCYYMWRLFKTFVYKSSFNIDYTFEGDFIPYPKPDSLRKCWHSSHVPEIYTYSTKDLEKPEIKGLPLNYVSTDTKDLSIRYSLLVTQLSLTKETFGFWEALRQQNIDLDNMHARQPYQLRGNITNTKNPDQPLLGYFTVAGIEQKRIYVNRPGLEFFYPICEPDFNSMRWIKYEPPSTWPIYLTLTITGALAMGSMESCFDCRLEDGTLNKPDFWEDK